MPPIPPPVTTETPPAPALNFHDSAVAFRSKSDAELKRAYWLFSLMNSPFLVRFGTKAGMLAMQLRLPITMAVKATMFRQFCGGTTLLECQTAIDHLYQFGVRTVLDYGAEAKETPEDFDGTMREAMRAIDFAAQNGTKVPVVSIKITGMCRMALLEKIAAQTDTLTETERGEWSATRKRLDAVCSRAANRGIGVFIDAEESWIQQHIDDLAEEMMARYNRLQVIVYNTFQIYRTDRLPYLRASYDRAQASGYLLGAKLVRGAYMEKERKRAAKLGYPSPIQPDKNACDHDYNEAVRFCVAHYTSIGSCVASHNEASTQLQVDLMTQNGIPNNHPHLTFSQLYGMSDGLTFNLADAGYNAAKYMVYGQVLEVFPYLVRRAQENTSLTGDMSREFAFLKSEVDRRKAQ